MQTYGEEYFKSQHYGEKEVAVKELYLRFLKWAHINQGNGKSALDVGASFGYVVRLLEELGYNSIGLEVSQYACEQSGLGNRMINGNAEDFAFEPCSFDLITAFEVIEHLPNPKNALNVIYQTLKPRGTFLMTTPTGFGDVLLQLYSTFTGREAKLEQHCSVFPFEDWKAILESVGFTEIESSKYFLTPIIKGKYRKLGSPFPPTNVAIQCLKAGSWRS